MNYIDIVITILLAIGIIRGFMKGFIYEVAVLGAMFLGLYAAFHLAKYVNPYILKVVHVNPVTLSLISFFVMFLAVAVGIFFLAKLFEGLVNMTGMGIFNKIAGAVFGGIKMALVISVLLFFINRVDTKYNWISPDKKAESKLYYPILKIAPTVLPVLKEAQSNVSKFL